MKRKELSCRMLIVLSTLIGMPLSGGCSTWERPFVPEDTKLPADVVIVPIVLENGMPFVEGMIDNSGPYKLLLDTGNAILTLSDEVADELDLPKSCSKATGITTSGAKVVAQRVVRVKELRLNKAIFSNFDVAVEEFDSFRRVGLEHDGVIGLRVLKECLLTIDFPRQQLRLERGALTRSDKLRVIPADIIRGSLRVPVFFGLDTPKPIVLKMILDTGFNGGIALPEVSRSYPFAFQPIWESVSITADGVHRREKGRLMTKMALDGAVIQDPIVSYVEGDDGMIGTEILRSWVITFDQAQGLVRLTLDRTSGDLGSGGGE